MAFELGFCPHGEETIARLRKLYADRDGGTVCASMIVPSPALERFAGKHPAGECGYPDPKERIAFWEDWLAERAAIHDDTIPSAYLSEMDQGLYGGLVGGEVRFLCDPEMGWISSQLPPVLKDWSGLDELAFSTDHEWWKRYVAQLEIFAAGARGKFGLSHFILINGLAFVFELIGASETYISMMERPDTVRRALELSFEVNVAVQNAFFEKTKLVAGGTCAYSAQWLPGRIISESCDPYHMTSVEHFEEWGRGILERVFAEYDGGITHIHANGRHLLEAVPSVKGLKALMLGDDRGYDPSFEVLDEIRPRVGDLPLTCFALYEPFKARLESGKLHGGVFYNVKEVPDVDAANALAEQVRKYRA